MEDRNNIKLILGMHRSGTSCLAGVMQRCGLHMGDVRKGSQSNKRGFYEIRKLQTIHDQILGLNNASWHSPPLSQIIFHPHHQNEIKNILNTLKDRRCVGIKDPRLLLMLEAWADVLQSPPAFVGTFRHPLAVVDSLAKRNKLEPEHTIELWKHYNAKLVECHKQNQFPLIHFDLSDKKKYLSKVEDLIERVGLKYHPWKVKWFVSQNLQNYKYKYSDVPDDCKKIFDYLMNNT